MKHKHQCAECGAIWDHGDDCMNNEQAHTCPNEDCKTPLPSPWRHYSGDKEATHHDACMDSKTLAKTPVETALLCWMHGLIGDQ